MQAPNRGSLSTNDIMTGDVSLVANQYTKIGEVVCPAGLIKKLGYGVSSSQSDAEGRIFAKFQTAAPAEIKGKLRVSIFSPQDRNLVTVEEWPTSALNSSENDRTKQIPFPVSMYGIGKDFKFVFEFFTATAATLSKANTVINIDTTEQLLA